MISSSSNVFLLICFSYFVILSKLLAELKIAEYNSDSHLHHTNIKNDIFIHNNSLKLQIDCDILFLQKCIQNLSSYECLYMKLFP